MNPSTLLIIGLGQTGVSCARYCQRQGLPYVLFDTRANPGAVPADIVGPLYTEQFPESLWPAIRTVVISPGVAPDIAVAERARALQIPVISDIKLFAKAAEAPIVAITGSNAKSTTTTLVGELISASGLRALVGGNIGTVAVDLLQAPVPDYYVLELSSFQLETTHGLKTRVAALLNLSANHLDRHQTMVAYRDAKLRIFAECETAVLGDSLSEELAPRCADTVQRIWTFGLGEVNRTTGVGVQADWIYYQHQPLLAVSELSQDLLGQHNLENVLAALTIVSALALPAAALKAVLQQFKGLPYRCRLVKTVQGVRWFNDSKGTTMAATAAAIRGIATPSGRLVLILGGQRKGQEFRELAPVVNQYVAQVIVFGQDQSAIADGLRGSAPIARVQTLTEAVAYAKTIAQAGDQVLFSPACASFDQFKNYLERGAAFDGLVNAL